MIALAIALVAAPITQMSEAQLSAKLQQVHSLPFPQRIDQLSALFIGEPYGHLPLGDGAGPEPGPRWRVDTVDCQTYVETVLALANAKSVSEAKVILDDIRYLGTPSFDNRNHFTESQWLPNNTQKGYVTDEVPVLDGRAPTEKLTLIKAQWSKVKALERLAGANIPDGQYQVRFLPMEELHQHVKGIEPGTIIFVVREYKPNLVVRISHMGFVIKTDQGWMVRHASSSHNRVMDVSFGEYVKEMAAFKSWKVTGFALAMPVDASLRVSQISKGSASADDSYKPPE